MIYVYYFFAVIQTFFAYKSLRGGIDYLEYFEKELSRPKSNYTPFASVIVPCRGIDEDLRTNLEAIILQDYPNFEVLFVVDDKNDSAVSFIEEIAGVQKVKVKRQNSVSQGLCSSRLVVVGKAIESGQKVHNLRTGVLEVSDESEVFIFVDSDARPNKEWLRNLVAPLEDTNIGCATGYRWFIQKSGGFATHLRSVWNASIASALGKNTKNNFCWGGSSAIRRETFEKLDIREKWKGTLSDDFALTNAMRKVEMSIHFVPSCLTATVEDCSFGEMLEFTTRQMKITRVYSLTNFMVSVIGSILFTLIFWMGIVLLFFVSGVHLWLTLAFILIIFVLGFAKAWIRLMAVKLVLTEYDRELNRQFIPQLSLWTISPILFLYNNFLAILSRKIIWRGIEYKLESPSKTIIGKTNGK